MRVKDYEYTPVSGDEYIDGERKLELLREIKDIVRKNNTVPLYRILEITDKSEELDFIYNWIDKNDVHIRGIDGTISGEVDNYNMIKKYGQSLRLDVMPMEEQRKYFAIMEKGKSKNATEEEKIAGKNARRTLIERNMKLADWVANWKSVNELVKIANKFDSSCEFRDYINSYAYDGLIRAVDGFDYKKTYIDENGEEKNYAFSTYACATITRDICKEMYKQLPIVRRVAQMYSVKNQFKKAGMVPQTKDYAYLMGMQEETVIKLQEEIEEAKRYGKNISSYEGLQEYDINEDRIINSFDDSDSVQVIGNEFKGNNETIRTTYQDKGYIVDGVYKDLGDEESVQARYDFNYQKYEDRNMIDRNMDYYDLQDSIMNALDTLTTREKFIVMAYYGLLTGNEMTYAQIGESIERTSNRVSQINARALRLLRHPSRSKHLRDFLRGEEPQKLERDFYAYMDSSIPIKHLYYAYLIKSKGYDSRQQFQKEVDPKEAFKLLSDEEIFVLQSRTGFLTGRPNTSYVTAIMELYDINKRNDHKLSKQSAVLKKVEKDALKKIEGMKNFGKFTYNQYAFPEKFDNYFALYMPVIEKLPRISIDDNEEIYPQFMRKIKELRQKEFGVEYKEDMQEDKEEYKTETVKADKIDSEKEDVIEEFTENEQNAVIDSIPEEINDEIDNELDTETEGEIYNDTDGKVNEPINSNEELSLNEKIERLNKSTSNYKNMTKDEKVDTLKKYAEIEKELDDKIAELLEKVGGIEFDE